MRLLFPVIPAILLAALILLGISDTDISVADTGIPDIQNNYQPN